MQVHPSTRLFRVVVCFCLSSWLDSAAAPVALALREKINWLMVTHWAGLDVVLGLCLNSHRQRKKNLLRQCY